MVCRSESSGGRTKVGGLIQPMMRGTRPLHKITHEMALAWARARTRRPRGSVLGRASFLRCGAALGAAWGRFLEREEGIAPVCGVGDAGDVITRADTPRPLGGARRRGWDSRQTITNAPVGWVAHTLMGRKCFFSAQRLTRNSLPPARVDGIVPGRRGVLAVLGGDFGRTSLRSASAPPVTKGASDALFVAPATPAVGRANECKFPGKPWRCGCPGLRCRRGRDAPFYGVQCRDMGNGQGRDMGNGQGRDMGGALEG
jgi:hypothetical protein